MQPILNVSPDDLVEPRRRLEAWIRIRAVMLWPLEAEKRSRAALAIYAIEIKHALELTPGEKITLPAMTLLNLIQGAAALPEFEREIETRQRRGNLAGGVLVEALRDGLAAPARGVKLEAIFKTVSDKFSVSESEVETVAWKRFRNVAHLWAALQVTLDKLKLPDELADFLGAAEQFRRRGEQEPVKGGTILRASETWRAPVWLNLPEIELVPGSA
jgi:hypothetical protein